MDRNSVSVILFFATLPDAIYKLIVINTRSAIPQEQSAFNLNLNKHLGKWWIGRTYHYRIYLKFLPPPTSSQAGVGAGVGGRWRKRLMRRGSTWTREPRHGGKGAGSARFRHCGRRAILRVRLQRVVERQVTKSVSSHSTMITYSHSNASPFKIPWADAKVCIRCRFFYTVMFV